MDDGRTGRFGQKHFGQQAYNILSGDEAALFIKEKTAVEIAIPSHPEIRARGDHGLGCHRLVFGQERVGNAVGKTPVRLMVQADERQRRTAF
jgi:hypothetical protein